MLHFPTGTLNLAPRPLGGPLRKTLVVAAALALAACSRPQGRSPSASRPLLPAARRLDAPGRQLAVTRSTPNAASGAASSSCESWMIRGTRTLPCGWRSSLYADPTIVAVVGHLSSGTSLAAARVYGGGATPTRDDLAVRVQSRPVGDQSLRVPGVPERSTARAPARALPGRRSRQASRHHLHQQRLWAGRARDVRGRVCAVGRDRARSRSLHPGHSRRSSRTSRACAAGARTCCCSPPSDRGPSSRYARCARSGCGGPCSAGTRSRDRGGRGARGGHPAVVRLSRGPARRS